MPISIVGYYVSNFMLHMPQSGTGNVTAVYVGFWNSMAITDDGNLWTWGNNANGELGNGSDCSYRRPILIMKP